MIKNDKISHLRVPLILCITKYKRHVLYDAFGTKQVKEIIQFMPLNILIYQKVEILLISGCVWEGVLFLQGRQNRRD
jgi:hypothetical protein